MKEHYIINGINYFVLHIAHDSEDQNLEMIVFTDSRDRFNNVDFVLGMNDIYISSKRFFEEEFIKEKHAIPLFKPLKKIIFGLYRHFKGKNYDVVGLGMNIETATPMVVYKARYEHEDHGFNSWWVRNKDMFFENVDKPEQHYSGPRFKYIGDE